MERVLRVVCTLILCRDIIMDNETKLADTVDVIVGLVAGLLLGCVFLNKRS